MRGLRRSTQRARNKGKIAQGAAIQMNHFLLNVEMSEWRSSTERGIRTMQRRFAARSPARPSSLGPMDVSPAHWAGSNEICGAVPSSSASVRSASLGEMRSQSSNADCRVEATPGAKIKFKLGGTFQIFNPACHDRDPHLAPPRPRYSFRPKRARWKAPLEQTAMARIGTGKTLVAFQICWKLWS
jgi:hypothetical protein